MGKFQFTYSDPSLTTSAEGDTPYGIYDNDAAFVSESVDVCKWTAKRLGHPVMQLEFNSSSIYAMFEEATSEYSLHINNYNMKNWMWESYGSDAKVSGSGWGNNGTSSRMGTGSLSVTHPHMGTTFMLSDQYGESIGAMGNVTIHTGSIVITGSKQEYDLQSEAVITASNSGKRLEIQEVFNYGPSSVTRFYDPFTGNYDQRNMLDNFGMGNVSPAVSFVLRPVSHDITRAQAIETSDKIRKSAYSFELINNQLRIFPIPEAEDAGDKIYFKYFVKEDRQSTSRTFTNNKVTDPSNVPYKFITYSEINAAGRQWIRKFTLALSKELLGIIRSKYASLPLPNGEVAMDGEALKSEGREEKTQLLEELKEFLESVSLTEKSKQEQEQAEAAQQVLNKAPLGIYLG
tara:strand:- start:769 stop:1977 length:1209 start_codon:yes stop_codon:yes gene_type:complete